MAVRECSVGFDSGTFEAGPQAIPKPGIREEKMAFPRL
jgi:hypothetical protein